MENKETNCEYKRCRYCNDDSICTIHKCPDTPCDDIDRDWCYYKRLHQKEQECEELEKSTISNCAMKFEDDNGQFVGCLERIADFAYENNKLQKQAEQLKQQLEVAVEALEKVKERQSGKYISDDEYDEGLKSAYSIATQALEQLKAGE